FTRTNVLHLSILLSHYIFFFYWYRPHRYLHSFPTRRSSDLTDEIVDHDPDFARVFLSECRVILQHMKSGDAELKAIAEKTVENRSEEHTSELQSRENLVCRLLLEKKNKNNNIQLQTEKKTYR